MQKLLFSILFLIYNVNSSPLLQRLSQIAKSSCARSLILRGCANSSQEWEYKTVYMLNTKLFKDSKFREDLDQEFNKLGSKGWEFVKEIQYLDTRWEYGSYTREMIALFKRAKNLD